MLKLSQLLGLLVISISIQAQQQLIAHWTPNRVNDLIIGEEVTDHLLLDESNAKDIFQVDYIENDIIKAKLNGVITKEALYNRCLYEKVNSEELHIIENTQTEVEGFPIQLKLLKNNHGQTFYATCFHLSYKIPESFELHPEWNGSNSILKHSLIYYEISSSNQILIEDIIRLIFQKLDKDANLNWTPPLTTNLTNNIATNNAEIIIYPNPTSEYIRFQSPNLKTMNIIIYNHQGRQIIKKLNHNLQQSLKINRLKEGSYYVQMEDEKQKITKEILVLR